MGNYNDDEDYSVGADDTDANDREMSYFSDFGRRKAVTAEIIRTAPWLLC